MKSILLIGLGRFGRNIAFQLNKLGNQVMAIDIKDSSVNSMLPYVTNAQIGDSTNKEFLKSLGVSNFDVCIVAIGKDFKSSLETTWNLKELNAKLVVARANDDEHEQFLLRNGADEILYPERQMAEWAGIMYSTDNILDYIDLDADYGIYEVPIPKEWIGKNVVELDIRKKYNINIIAVKKNGVLNAAIRANTTFEEEESILVIADYKSLQKCFNNKK